LANLADGRIDTVFDIDEHRSLPKATGDLFAGDYFAAFGDQEGEKFERLPLKFEPAASPGELKFPAIKGELAELIDGIRHPFPPEVAEV
jgi:hypothetical protein